MADFEEAKDRGLMGRERKSLVISETEKLTTAYHEAGHALVAHRLAEADPVHKVTIIPRGRALGTTLQSPEEDRCHLTKRYLKSSVAILLAGRSAEEIFLNSVTTAASSDLKQVTKLARKMVCEWGMSEELGPLNFGKNEEYVFLGREVARHRRFSIETSIKIDQEVKKVVLDGYDQARKILQAERKTLVRLAEALLEYETLDAHEFKAVIKGERISPAGGGVKGSDQSVDSDEVSAKEPACAEAFPP